MDLLMGDFQFLCQLYNRNNKSFLGMKNKWKFNELYCVEHLTEVLIPGIHR